MGGLHATGPIGASMAYQYVWQTHLWEPGDGGWWKGEKSLLEYDPEMLDLALGALFKYDP